MINLHETCYSIVIVSQIKLGEFQQGETRVNPLKISETNPYITQVKQGKP